MHGDKRQDTRGLGGIVERMQSPIVCIELWGPILPQSRDPLHDQMIANTNLFFLPEASVLISCPGLSWVGTCWDKESKM